MKLETAIERAERFIRDWLREDCDKLACSREMFKLALAEALCVFHGSNEEEYVQICDMFDDAMKKAAEDVTPLQLAGLVRPPHPH